MSAPGTRQPDEAQAPAAETKTTTDSRRVAFTIGHSTQPMAEFIDMLTGHGITTLVDVRTVPRSRHNPHYNRDTLPEALAPFGIGYTHAEGLGGFRPTTPDSPNTGWRNKSFRGYADYMQTPEFAENLFWVVTLADQQPIALMCAEAVPWRCHRSLIADALLVRDVDVEEIVSPTRLQLHKLTPFAQVDETVITYPALTLVFSIGLAWCLPPDDFGPGIIDLPAAGQTALAQSRRKATRQATQCRPG